MELKLHQSKAAVKKDATIIAQIIRRHLVHMSNDEQEALSALTRLQSCALTLLEEEHGTETTSEKGALRLR